MNKERKLLFIFALSFTLFGMLMVYEASSIYAWRLTADGGYFFKRQMVCFFLGLALFFSVLALNLRDLRRYFRPALIFNIILLLIVLLAGKSSGGARRWLSLFGFNLQPSEFLKVSFMLYCTDYLQRKGPLIRNFKKGLLPLFVISGLAFLLVVLEPDLGTVIFLSLWMFAMLFIHNARMRHLVLIFLVGLCLSGILVKLYPYRFARITAYFDPWKDPRGSGFQLIQSQIAYGSGGLWGVGLGESKQKLLYLPAAHTDFIFSIIAEEFGYAGSLALLAFFVFFFMIIMRMAGKMRDPFLSALCRGIGLIFGLEFAINIGVTCGLFPTKGLSLPFISYGGSSLIAHYLLLAVLFNASRQDELLCREQGLEVKTDLWEGNYV